MSAESSHAGRVVRMRTVSHLAGITVIVIGSLVILSWILNFIPLRNLLPSPVTMKFNAALCFVLAGSALILWRSRPRLALVFSIMVVAVGLLTLVEYVFGWNLGIDQWLIEDTLTPDSTNPPGRMAFVTALSFCLIGSSLILITRSRYVGLAQALALFTGLLALSALAGYMHDVDSLYQMVAMSTIAVLTAVTFIILCAGIFFADMGRGLAAVILSDHAGGLLARRLLPISIFAPLVIDWLRLQIQQTGLFEAEFGMVMVALSNAVLFASLIFWFAWSLNLIDSQRSHAMEALRQAHGELEQRVHARTVELEQTNAALEISERTLRLLFNSVQDYAIIMLDRSGNIVNWNPGAENLKGYTEQEIIGQSFSRFYMPEDNARGEPQRILQIAERDGHFVGEGWRVRKDGSRFWGSIVITAIRDENNVLVGYSKVARDLTERMERERQLRFHASLQAAVTDAVIATDLNFNIQSWNKAAENVYGWRSEEVIGRSASEVLKTIFPSEQPRDQILHDFADQGFWTGEVIQHRKDGSEIHILGSTILFHDEWGNPLGVVAVNHDITKRKRAEEALRLSEERYRNLSSVLWDYACAYRYISDDEAQLEWVVGAFEEISGHKPEDAQKDFKLSTPVHPDDQEIFRERHKKLRSGQDDISEFRIINTRGEVRWLRSYGRPEWDETHQKVIRVYIGVQDIGERKRIEQELQQQRDFAQQVMNALGQGVTVVDAEGRFEYVNPAYARIVGRPLEEIIGKTPLDMTIPEDHQTLIEARSRRQVGETSTYETRFRQPDGRMVHALITGTPRLKDGQIIGSFSVITDLTERKQVENLFRALLESAPDPMIITNPEGRITLINTQAEQVFGYSKADLIGKNVDVLIPEMLHSAHTQHRQQYVEMSRARAMGSEKDLYATRNDGTMFPVEISLSPIETDGQLLVASAIRDITLRKQFEQALDDARKRAEEANRMKSEFLATMSHELRTPLNAIIGFSDAMLNKLAGELNNAQHEYINIILSNGEHLLALITSLLDISKIEAGQLELRNTNVNLHALLEDIHRNFQNLVDQKGLKLISFLDPALPTRLVGDEMRLKQILINLVGNSIKFTSVGQVDVNIIKMEDCFWTIIVRDTGIGIPAEALDYVFEQFRQVDNSSTRRYEGTGLGLAIVQRLVTLMGGSITVESEVEKGSTFTIRLPLIAE